MLTAEDNRKTAKKALHAMRANSWSLQRQLCTLCELPARRQQRKLWAQCELTAEDNRQSAKKARHAMQANSMKTAYTHRQLSNPSRFFANQCLQSQRSSKGPPDVRVQSRSQSSSAKFSIHSGSIHHRPTHIVAILSPPPQHQLRSQRRSRHIPLFFRWSPPRLSVPLPLLPTTSAG